VRAKAARRSRSLGGTAPTVVVRQARQARRRATARATLAEDEVRRTHAFLVVSGALAVVGCGASFLFDGHALVRLVFAASVAALLAGYVALWLHTRDLTNYTPAKAVAVITVCNLAGISASLYYGLYSPAPMILMLPIAFIGLSSSGAGAMAAYAFAASSIGVPMGLVAVGLLDDPGLVRAGSLSALGLVLYTGLVQAVYAACFVYARASRRATLAAVEGLERALRQVEAREDLLEEANLALDEALLGGSQGPMTGSDLGDWRLAALLGRGAMGDVYAAVRRSDNLHGALKVLNPVVASDPEAIQLMRREVDLLSRVTSPHVVRVYEVGVDAMPWVSMERLRGEDLSALLRRERTMSPDQVVDLLEQVGDGLDAAHRQRILHRDLKPSNLFRTAATREEPALWKILDFGVAKQLGQDLTVTRGQMLGTPGYIPPEALERNPQLDERADIWALAVVAYRALTGTRPFHGIGHDLILSVVRDQPERPTTWVDLPGAVDEVIAVGLAKDPRERFATAAGFARAMAEAVDGRIDPPLQRQARRLLDQLPWGGRV